MKEDPRVVIVGAGPVGLCVALGLVRAGHRVLVLEKELSTATRSRAPAIWPRTQAVLEGLGVLDELSSEAIVLPTVVLRDADREQPLLQLPLHELARETDHARLLLTPQSRTEAVLARALRALDPEAIRFGAEVTAVRPRNDGVAVRYRWAGSDEGVRVDYLIGCDGARSTVRKALGLGFEGTTYSMRAALADVEIAAGAPPAGPRLSTAAGLVVAVPIEARVWRLILPFTGEDDRDLDQRIEECSKAVFPSSTERQGVLWKSEFKLHRRLADHFAVGRVALAGDAAHLNSPVGGQGMNAGIQDSECLLAHLLRALGGAGPAALEDYETERRAAIAGGVNVFTDRLTRALLFGDGKLVRGLLRTAGAALRLPPLRRRFLRRAAMLR